MVERRVPGFAPSVNGFRFPNAFPPGPLFRLGRGRLSLPVGDASAGLCGGMVFAARDLFEAGLSPPPDPEPPSPGSPLFRYLVWRLFASFDLPLGPLRYLAWMALPAADRWGLRGLASRTRTVHWPRIRADLDAGRPVPIGLVRVRSLNPLEVGRNHQVLAYGYHLDPGERVRVLVYDPNHPGRDDLALTLDPLGADIGYVPGESPVRGFFRTRYRPPVLGIPEAIRRAAGPGRPGGAKAAPRSQGPFRTGP